MLKQSIRNPLRNQGIAFLCAEIPSGYTNKTDNTTRKYIIYHKSIVFTISQIPERC